MTKHVFAKNLHKKFHVNFKVTGARFGSNLQGIFLKGDVLVYPSIDVCFIFKFIFLIYSFKIPKEIISYLHTYKKCDGALSHTTLYSK